MMQQHLNEWYGRATAGAARHCPSAQPRLQPMTSDTQSPFGMGATDLHGRSAVLTVLEGRKVASNLGEQCPSLCSAAVQLHSNTQ